MIRVVVADDHAVVRRGVIQILSEAGDMVVVGEASDGRETLRLVQRCPCDVLLLDIAMPGGGGLDVLAQVHGLCPDLRTLVLSMYPEQQYATRALRAGAAGYLTKESAPDELIAAIRHIAAGGRYVSRTLAEALAEELGADVAQEPHHLLSNREYQVMCALAGGKTVGEIAGDLGLSVKTISTYRTRILEKLHLNTTAEIMRYVFDHNLND
ncbi:MAG: response regulator transcription factor [Anaerolineae bacterium]|nr:response regulator transcription factor [Anaerolineae bacterium]